MSTRRKQVVDRGYGVPEVAASLSVSAHSLYKCFVKSRQTEVAIWFSWCGSLTLA